MDAAPATAPHRDFTKSKWFNPLLTAAILAALSIWLNYTSGHKNSTALALLAAYQTAAGLGVYLLSRRWISQYPGRLLAAILYAFGPVAMQFLYAEDYAIQSGLFWAIFPWLNLPAVLWPIGKPPTFTNRTIHAGLVLGGTGVFLLLSYLNTQQKWIPSDWQMKPQALIDLFSPLLKSDRGPCLSLCHIPLITAALGLLTCLHSRKKILPILILVSILMSLFKLTPMIVPFSCIAFAGLYLSVLAGLGAQTIAWLGKADKHYLSLCIILSAGLWLLAHILRLRGWETVSGGNENLGPASLYAIALVLFTSIYYMILGGFRWTQLRWGLLILAFAADILLCAKILI